MGAVFYYGYCMVVNVIVAEYVSVAGLEVLKKWYKITQEIYQLLPEGREWTCWYVNVESLVGRSIY